MTTDTKALDLAAALIDKSHLHDFDGRKVLATTISLTGAGDGLSKALKIEPREFHHGERVFVVYEAVVAKVGFQPLAEGTEELQRNHTLQAVNATIVDGDLVQKHLDEQAQRIQAAIDTARGQVNLEGTPGYLADSAGPVADEDEEALVLRRNHMAGNHAEGTMEGCPVCDQELAAEAAERAQDEVYD